MDAALHQHCTIPAGLMEVDTPASADLKCEPVKYLSSRRQNNNEDLFKAKHTVNNHNSNDATDKNKLKSMVVVKVLADISSSENEPKSQ